MAGQSDNDYLRLTFGGTYGLDEGGVGAYNSMTDFAPAPIVKAADDSMAADATANTKFWNNPFDFNVEIISAAYNANGTITAHDTNYGNINILSDDGADSAPAIGLMLQTSIGTVAGVVGTGNIATDVSKEFQTSGTGISAAARILVPNANAWWSITKAGAGVVMRAGLVVMRIRRR